MQYLSLSAAARAAFLGSSSLLIIALLGFWVLEPKVGRSASATSGPFTITQTIDSAISFTTEAADVTMVGAINGLTGGNATGTTIATVRTNNSDGYYMTIHFANEAPAMLGNAFGGTGIRDYADAGEPDFAFQASTSAQLAYTVTTDTPSDLDQSFADNGSACNAGSNTTANTCWMGPDTTPFQIVDRGSSAVGGSTTTIQFRVHVPNAPSPQVDSDTYTATATLTATTN